MKRAFTPTELAELLRVEPKTLTNWRYLGRGPAYVKDGGVIRYRREDIEAWIRQHTMDPQVGEQQWSN